MHDDAKELRRPPHQRLRTDQPHNIAAREHGAGGDRDILIAATNGSQKYTAHHGLVFGDLVQPAFHELFVIQVNIEDTDRDVEQLAVLHLQRMMAEHLHQHLMPARNGNNVARPQNGFGRHRFDSAVAAQSFDEHASVWYQTLCSSDRSADRSSVLGETIGTQGERGPPGNDAGGFLLQAKCGLEAFRLAR